MFGGGRQSIRDVVPTEAEGDALLDMLFDDAPRPSQPGPGVAPSAPHEEAGEAVVDAVIDEDAKDAADDEQPTRIHAADEVAGLLDGVRQPKLADAGADTSAPKEPSGEV